MFVLSEAYDLTSSFQRSAFTMLLCYDNVRLEIKYRRKYFARSSTVRSVGTGL